MVSKASLKNALKEHVDWLYKNPRPSIIKVTKQTAKTFHKGLEMDIRWATVPSLIVPMPKSRVNQLQKLRDKFKGIK